VEGISFEQEKFQKIAIAGESGAGKSTLLKIIAGLVQPDAGEVVFEDDRVRGPYEKLIPGHPGIAYLSQHFELRNNYRVEELLSYANELAAEEAEALFDVCRIRPFLKRKTDQLSGGEKQRIALARLLISSPRLLLLDEPFSNLDLIHKNILKSVVRDIGERLHITCMLVSHDPMDTLSWADEIMIMRNGRILQKGTPETVYSQPVNEYAAALLGTYNIINGPGAKDFAALPGIEINGKTMIIRPERFTIVGRKSPALKGKVQQVNYFGSFYDIQVELPGSRITVRTGKSKFKTGDTIYLTLDSSAVWYV
jgi:ABC-type sugar transport system ATPase subunit